MHSNISFQRNDTRRTWFENHFPSRRSLNRINRGEMHGKWGNEAAEFYTDTFAPRSLPSRCFLGGYLGIYYYFYPGCTRCPNTYARSRISFKKRIEATNNSRHVVALQYGSICSNNDGFSMLLPRGEVSPRGRNFHGSGSYPALTFRLFHSDSHWLPRGRGGGPVEL